MIGSVQNSMTCAAYIIELKKLTKFTLVKSSVHSGNQRIDFDMKLTTCVGIQELPIGQYGQIMKRDQPFLTLHRKALSHGFEYL